jgi:hypothetical protein
LMASGVPADAVPAGDVVAGAWAVAGDVVADPPVAALLPPPHAVSTSASRASATHALPPRAALNDLRIRPLMTIPSRPRTPSGFLVKPPSRQPMMPTKARGER